MHEFLPFAHFVCTRGMRTLFAAALSLGLLLPAAASTEQQTTSYAIESQRASESLLLGITRAGKRLVTVGERGHVLYSDNEGESWQQGKVPTRQLLTAVFLLMTNTAGLLGTMPRFCTAVTVVRTGSGSMATVNLRLPCWISGLPTGNGALPLVPMAACCALMMAEPAG